MLTLIYQATNVQRQRLTLLLVSLSATPVLKQKAHHIISYGNICIQGKCTFIKISYLAVYKLFGQLYTILTALLIFLGQTPKQKM